MTVNRQATVLAQPIFARLDALWQQPERVCLQGKDAASTVTMAQLQRLTARKAAQLRQSGAQRCLIFRAQTADFISDFLACVSAGVEVILPANGQPQTLKQLRSAADVLACDGVEEAIFAVDCTVPPALAPLQDITVTVFTSGSTGQAKAIAKPLSRYLAEVAELENRWGQGIAPNATVFSSVSHQHVYGLLFTVLWPLAFARPNFAHTVAFEEHLYACLRAQSGAPSVFVSSPAFLTRLSVTPPRQALGSLQAVFSSGGLLTTVQAQTAAQHFNCRLWRIYGSSESGGVAYQNSDTDVWQAFTHVQLASEAGVLQIDSPYAYRQPLRMDDRAELLNEQQFYLRGRVDDVVKIGEKRVSLNELNRVLGAHPWVLQAATVALTQPRDCLGAVLCLTSEGQSVYVASPRQFQQTLRGYLSDFFAPVTQPKYYRVVSALPHNAQGKMTRAQLLALFASESWPPKKTT